MVSLLDFINSISQMDDIQDVKSSKSWWKSDVLALGKGGGEVVRLLRHPLGYGNHLQDYFYKIIVTCARIL